MWKVTLWHFKEEGSPAECKKEANVSPLRDLRKKRRSRKAERLSGRDLKEAIARGKKKAMTIHFAVTDDTPGRKRQKIRE